jgi:anti-sigma-K factor RskA
LTLASVAGLVTVATFASGILTPVSQTKPLVAELTGDASTTINLLAQYDAGNGALKITPVAAKQAEAKSLELWLIEGDNPAKSLGILPQTGEGEIIIPAELRSKFGAGVTLAVSVEPFGGSPTGTATGPVVAVGKTRLP